MILEDLPDSRRYTKAQIRVDTEDEGNRQGNKWDPNQFVSQSGFTSAFYRSHILVYLVLCFFPPSAHTVLPRTLTLH